MAVLALRPLLPAFVALEPLVLAFTREPRVLTLADLQQLVLAFRGLEPQGLEPPPLASVRLEPLLLPFRNGGPLVPSVLGLGQLLLASVALEPPVLGFRNRQPPVLAVLSLEQLLPASVALEPLLLAYKPLEPLVKEPPSLGRVNLKNLLVVRKNRSSSSPAGASSQIAPPGRSGIILRGKSKSTRFDL